MTMSIENTLEELQKEINVIKSQLEIIQKTLGRSAWNTSKVSENSCKNNFGFNNG